MSYILDALKKSESQRNANRIPTVSSAQSVPIEHAHSTRMPLLALALAACALAAAAAWWLFARDAQPRAAAVANAAPDVRTPPAEATEPASSGRAASETMPRLRLATSLPAARETRAAVRAEAKSSPPAPGATSPREPAASAPVAPTPAKGEIVAFANLPAGIRQALPPLSISGFAAGDSGAAMIVVDDKLLREGDEAAPGLRVEKILPDGAEFSFKGYRFRR